MKFFIGILLVLGAIASGFAATKKKPPVKRTKTAAPRITAAQRAEARDAIASHLKGDNLRIENPEALQAFYTSLDSRPIHILQFGDSHTASDDWVQSMRALLQTKYGDGGPGFVQAGRPFRGYRRFDAHGNNSAGWVTEGTMAARGDPNQGLSGISISTQSPGQTATLSASGETLGIFYLQQPGGGAIEVQDGSQTIGTIATAGETGPGIASYTLTPGTHDLTLRTLDRAPVRLFGWALDKPSGLTTETLGINGAQANVILGWNEAIWASEVAARNPSLIILAYGTNEANNPRWMAEQYRADLESVIQRVRHAAPQASILMIGPPDCGKLHPLRFLSEVIAVQKDIAREQHVAFWDWRTHMGGPGSIRSWVTAGYAQADYIHMTGEGYQMLGEMVVTALMDRASGDTK